MYADIEMLQKDIEKGDTLEGMVDAALVKAEETKSAKPKTFTSLLSKMMKS